MQTKALRPLSSSQLLFTGPVAFLKPPSPCLQITNIDVARNGSCSSALPLLVWVQQNQWEAMRSSSSLAHYSLPSCQVGILVPEKLVQTALAARQQKFCSSWKVALKMQLTDAASSFLARCRVHAATLQANLGKTVGSPQTLLPVTYAPRLPSRKITRAG